MLLLLDCWESWFIFTNSPRMKLYCSYQDCRSVRETYSSITFFQIPKSDDPRRQIWINNSGNPYLRTLKPNTTCFFCEKHFDSKMIRKQFSRTTLNKFAVPIKYGEKFNERNEPDSTKPVVELSAEATNEVLLYDDSKFAICIIAEPENYEIEDDEIRISLEKNETKIEQYSSELSPKQIKRKHNEISTCEDNLKIRVLNNIKNEENTKKKLADNYQIINEFSFDDDSLSSAICFELNKNDDLVELNPGISNDGLTDELKPETYSIISFDSKVEKIDENEISETEPKKSVVPETKQMKGCTCREGEKESDKNFLLSLLDNFQRLPYQKKTIAKIKILQYLNSLENYENELENILN